MKRFIFASFATLALSTAAVPATQANPVSYNPSATQPTATERVTPDEIVTMAQRGQLKAQGIPGGMQLTSDYVFGRTNAQKLVEKAIAAGLVPEETRSDRGYIHAVESALETHLHLN